MARFTPAEITEKWQRKMQGAGQDYINGVNRVQRSPGELAAQNEAGYVNGVNEAVTTGKWRQNVAAVTLQDWQQAAVSKGAQRLAQGAASAGAKVQAAHERIAPMLDRAAAEVQRIPRDTLENRIARSVAHMRSMAEQARGQRGRRGR